MFMLFLAVTMAWAPPVQVIAPPDAPLVVRRGSYTLTLQQDRLEILLDGQPVPSVFLLPQVPSPSPVDPPRPVPTKIEKLRVVLVGDPLAPLTPAQQAVFFSPAVADWLNAHCFADGSTKAWRRWDARVTTGDLETAGWRAAATLVRTDPRPLPKIVIFDDARQVASEPLPDDEARVIDLLEKYGGK